MSKQEPAPISAADMAAGYALEQKLEQAYHDLNQTYFSIGSPLTAPKEYDGEVLDEAIQAAAAYYKVLKKTRLAWERNRGEA